MSDYVNKYDKRILAGVKGFDDEAQRKQVETYGSWARNKTEQETKIC